MRKILIVLALSTLWVSAYNFENKQRVDEVVTLMDAMVNDVEYNVATKKLKVTKRGGTNFEVDLSSLYGGGVSNSDLNSLVKKITLDSSSKKLKVEKYNGTLEELDISDLYNNANIVSGVLNNANKRMELTLNDSASTKVFIDMATLYNAINALHAKEVTNLEYTDDLLRISTIDGTTHEATIPVASPFKKGLMDKSDKETLDKISRTKVIAYFAYNTSGGYLVSQKIAGVDSNSVIDYTFVNGTIVNDGNREMLTISYAIKLRNIEPTIKFPSDGEFKVVVDMGGLLEAKASVGNITLKGGGMGTAVARCGSPTKKLPLYSLLTHTMGGKLVFFAPNASHIYNPIQNGAPGTATESYSPVLGCEIRGTLSVAVSRP